MARRTLINLDEKILCEAVRQGANNGVAQISALNIARKLGISDTSVFVHFKNKNNLIISAKNYVDEHCAEAMQPHIQPDPNYSVKARWECMVNYFVEHADFTKFLDSYAHSNFCSYEVTDRSGPYIAIAKKLMKHSEPYPFTDEEYFVIWNALLENTISFSVKIIDKVVESTPRMMDVAYNIIYGEVVPTK